MRNCFLVPNLSLLHPSSQFPKGGPENTSSKNWAHYVFHWCSLWLDQYVLMHKVWLVGLLVGRYFCYWFEQEMVLKIPYKEDISLFQGNIHVWLHFPKDQGLLPYFCHPCPLQTSLRETQHSNHSTVALPPSMAILQHAQGPSWAANQLDPLLWNSAGGAPSLTALTRTRTWACLLAELSAPHPF